MEDEKREEETPEAQAEDAEMMQRLQEEIRNLSVSDHLAYMMHSLSALAVGRMGLSAETEARRDLEQARLAIDGYKALMQVMERARPVEETTAYRGMLSELQLAYVGVVEGGAAAETPEEPTDSGEGPREAPGEPADSREEPEEAPGESAEEPADSPEKTTGAGAAPKSPKRKRKGGSGKRTSS